MRSFLDVPSCPGTDPERRGRLLGVAAIASGLLLLAVANVPAYATPKVDDEHTVTVCHATDSGKNPYVAITVDVASVLFQGHAGHLGPVWVPSHPKHEKWGDIIAPFDFGPGAQYAGMNVPDGWGFLDRACELPGATTTEAPGTTEADPD